MATTGESTSDTDIGTETDEMVNPLDPWGAAEPVDGLNTPDDEDDPSLSPDMLEIYFASDRDGIEDIYVASRSSLDAAWGGAAPVASLASLPPGRGNPAVSPDGNTLFFTINDAGNIDLYVASRASALMPFTDAEPISNLINTAAGDEFSAAPSGDLLSVVFSRNAAPSEGTTADLFIATRPAAAASWEAPAPIVELNSPAEDATAWVNPDVTVLMFASERATPGTKDLYISVRVDPAQTWDPPVPVDSLNTADDEQDPWFSADGRTIFFARSAGADGPDLYTATR